ncbi:MAG: ABC transporter permease [Vicinamibacteraceae bacterium]
MSQLKLWVRRGSQQPGRSAFLLLSLSVSLAGAVAAISLNSAVWWRALPFVEAESLVNLEVRNSEGRARWWSWPELQAVARDAPPSLHAVTGYTVADVNIASEPGRPPQALLATMVLPEFLRVLGVRVSVGRPFNASEHLSGSPRVVLLTHELWQQRYGGDPQVVGRTIDLSTPEYLGEPGGSYVVIGVLAPETWLFWRRSDLVLPLRAHPQLLSNPRERLVEHVVGRLRPEATVASARAHAPSLVKRLRGTGGADATDTVIVEELRSALFRDLQPRLRLVLTIAVLVIVLAGVNVIIATSSAGLERQKETALRLAIGAAPRRLALDAASQLALTAVTASLLALAVSGSFIDVILAHVPDSWLARVPGGADAVRVDSAALTTLVIVTFVLATTSAFWTYRRIHRIAVSPLLDTIQQSDSPRRQRWRAVLVGSEMALCAAVVLVATTLGVQLWVLRTVDVGVRADGTFALWINASAPKYRDPASRLAYFKKLSDELSGISGVAAVGAVDLTFQFDWQTTRVRAGVNRASAPITALDRAATSTYLDASGITLIDGRWLEAQDRSGAPPVAVVSQSLADALWPNQRAVGQTLQLDASKSEKRAAVVGVVSDVRPAPQAPPSRIVYRSVAQIPPSWLYFVVKTPANADVLNQIQPAVWRVDPDQPVDGPWAIQDWIENATSSVRFLATLTAMLAGIGIVLAAAGLHALTVYWVEASRRELGIRRALGASHRDVLAWFAAKWGGVVGPAVLAGLLLQFMVLRATASQIEAVQPASIGHLALGTTAVAFCAAAAAAVALIRALRANEHVLMR